MGKVIKLADWEPDQGKRAKKKRLIAKLNKFLKRAEVFFEKAGSERGKKMIKEVRDDD